MSTFNRVIATVHLTREPELKETPNKKTVGRLGVASNHTSTNEAGVKFEEVWWGTVDVHGPTAATIHRWFRKGDPITVEGRLKTEQWEKDGVKQSATKLVLERFHFVPGHQYHDRQAAGPAPERREPRPAAANPEEDGRIPVG